MSFLPVLMQNEEQLSLQSMLKGPPAEAEQAKRRFLSFPPQEGVALVLLDELQHLISISGTGSKGPPRATAAMPSAGANPTGSSAHVPERLRAPDLTPPWVTAQTDASSLIPSRTWSFPSMVCEILQALNPPLCSLRTSRGR